MMMDWLSLFNVAFVALLCVAVGAVIVAPTIHEGPFIKVGLIVLFVGWFGVCAQITALADVQLVRPLLWSLTLVNAGLSVTGGGLAWRVWHQPEARQVLRRVTGWGDLPGPADPLDRAR